MIVDVIPTTVQVDRACWQLLKDNTPKIKKVGIILLGFDQKSKEELQKEIQRLEQMIKDQEEQERIEKERDEKRKQKRREQAEM